MGLYKHQTIFPETAETSFKSREKLHQQVSYALVYGFSSDKGKFQSQTVYLTCSRLFTVYLA